MAHHPQQRRRCASFGRLWLDRYQRQIISGLSVRRNSIDMDEVAGSIAAPPTT
jgi:hypothetical protein